MMGLLPLSARLLGFRRESAKKDLRVSRKAQPPSMVSRVHSFFSVAPHVGAIVNAKSPTSQRMLKFAFNLADDGLVGQQLFAGEATRLAYMTDEAAEGRDAFLEKRPPDWSPFPWYF